jgi:hypothetical protein
MQASPIRRLSLAGTGDYIFEVRIFRSGEQMQWRAILAFLISAERPRAITPTGFPEGWLTRRAPRFWGGATPRRPPPRPTIKASTTGTRGLFTPVLVLTASSWEACSAADGFSDMSFFLLSFREIIPKSNYIPQTNKAIPPELEGYLLCYHGGIGGEMLCRPSRAKNFLDKYAVFIE